MPSVDTDTKQTFVDFVETVEPRLVYALTAAYGPEVGKETTRDALAYAWEHWERISEMENPAGYLFRVGQSRSRRYLRRRAFFPPPNQRATPLIEPGLPAALASLSGRQRVAVVLLHGEGYPDREVADLMGVTRATARKHAERGLAKLRAALGGDES